MIDLVGHRVEHLVGVGEEALGTILEREDSLIRYAVVIDGDADGLVLQLYVVKGDIFDFVGA